MNLSILDEVKPKTSLEASTLQLTLHYFGHVVRAKGSLEQDIILGQITGYRWQGKSWMRWLDSIKEATRLQLGVLKKQYRIGKNGA